MIFYCPGGGLSEGNPLFWFRSFGGSCISGSDLCLETLFRLIRCQEVSKTRIIPEIVDFVLIQVQVAGSVERKKMIDMFIIFKSMNPLGVQICNHLHGLPLNLFWPHKTQTCTFMERLSQQRENLWLLEKAIIQGKTIRDPVDTSDLGSLAKLFQPRQSVRHQDIQRLVDQAIKKMKTRAGPKKNWNVEEISVLIWVVHQFQRFYGAQFYNLSLEVWESISSYVPGKTRDQCLFKTLKSQKMMLSDHPWQKQEESVLLELVEVSVEKDWNRISEDLYFRSGTPRVYRLPKQCREHWSSYLVYELKKGPWEVEEDVVLLETVMKIGKRWTEIGKHLSGRTQNAIKNRCNLLLTKYETISEDSSFNQNIQKLIERIKEENSKKLNKKSLRKLRSRNQSQKSGNEVLEGNNVNFQQLVLEKEGRDVEGIKEERSQEGVGSQSEMKVRYMEEEKFCVVGSLTNIERNFRSLEDIEFDNFHPEDVGRYLFVDEFQFDNLESSSLNRCFQ